MFDYLDLDRQTRDLAMRRAGEIKALTRRAAETIREIGLKLLEVQAAVGAGHFEGWLREEFDWSRRTAYRYITVAQQFRCANLAQVEFSTSALYLLAEPSTPEPARQEALSRAAAGEPISHATARGIVDGHRPRLGAGVEEALGDMDAEEQLAFLQSQEAAAVADDDEDPPPVKPVVKHDGTVCCPMCQGKARVKPHARDLGVKVAWPVAVKRP